MDLNKLILDAINRYADTDLNISSELFRKKLASEIEAEVDKYCMMLISSFNQ